MPARPLTRHSAYQRILETINSILNYDKNIEIWIEPKPNEPTDQAYVPTIGLDVKAIRTQRGTPVTDHLKNSREIFLHLVEKSRTLDTSLIQQYRDARDYESMELYILKHLLGI